ncbi:hypothetical protein RA27_18130 [Ruegeria sp. ANG-R]|uniref:sugar phosphate isomerase/epimerase family protein n=1 Tax=Ruegeria sp. ANG-R TaxID=1577903 RepID=UPI00057C9B5A|nr:sugar phosphate isomerase/epimerase family protein [Ruegeria sp. ANG-R]KIC39063.1 hypothetical protein RA27_18130 [Ruegeria sp. ANG-R]
MQFAVSNIAWQASDRRAAYARLERAGITGLEVAPGLLFSDSEDPFLPTERELAAVLDEISAYGLSLVSMQSLLFGVSGADLFGDAEGQIAFSRGLGRAIDLAARLGLPNLVLGSPKQRIRPAGMTSEAAMEHAAAILRPLADKAAASGIRIAMECNPVDYGTNFLTTPDETLAFVRYAAHPAIALNFDIGASYLTGTFAQVNCLIEDAGDTISHVHISEPFLSLAPADPTEAGRVLCALQDIGYKHAVSIEMRQPENGLTGLDEALRNLAVARNILEASATGRARNC